MRSKADLGEGNVADRKSTRLNSSHVEISYAVFCLTKNNDRSLRQSRAVLLVEVRERDPLDAAGEILECHERHGAAVPVRDRLYFFFNDTATTEIYTLSLHDALPI